MPDDPRPRYHVLQPIEAKNGAFFWMRVGTAYKNPDGTIDAYFEAIVIGARFRLRAYQPGEPDAVEPDTAASAPELLS